MSDSNKEEKGASGRSSDPPDIELGQAEPVEGIPIDDPRWLEAYCRKSGIRYVHTHLSAPLINQRQYD